MIIIFISIKDWFAEKKRRKRTPTCLSWSNIILLLVVFTTDALFLLGIIFIKAILSLFSLFFSLTVSPCRQRYHAIEITLARWHCFSPAIEWKSRKWMSNYRVKKSFSIDSFLLNIIDERWQEFYTVNPPATIRT